MRKPFENRIGWLAAAWLWLCGAMALAQVPGAPIPSGSEASAQKPGSVLVYNLFTSATANPNVQETEISITNTNAAQAAGVRLFFINGANGAVSNQALRLAPNQTASIYASQAAPNITGYAVAVAIDGASGCPVSFNFLRGSASIKFSPASGFVARLPAVALAALYTGVLGGCSAGSPSATFNFDGVSYNRLPRLLAADNIPSRADSNSGLVVVNRLRGNLLTGMAPLGVLSGSLFNDAEQSFAFTATVSSSQLRGSLSDSFPNTTPSFSSVIPAGRSGWMTLSAANGSGLLGAVINFNFGANAASNPDAFNHGRNLHILTLNTSSDSLAVPVIPINVPADLALTQTAAPNPVTAGQPLTYSLNVTNDGPGAATAVTVTDVLPAGATFVSAAATQGSCTTSAGTVACALGTLNAGQAVALTIVVRPATAGALSNTATVNAASVDLNTGNNTATTSVTVVAGSPQLQITIEGGNLEFGPVPAGRTPNPNPTSRTIVVANPGSGALDFNFASTIRTGADVASGKITDADDRRLFLLRSIAANGVEMPVNISAPLTIGPGQQRRFRILFDPIIPALAGRTANLSARNALSEMITSRMTINHNAGVPAAFNLIGRLTTGVKLIHPVDPQLAPLVTFARSDNDLIVECSVYDPNLDLNLIRYQFLDQSGRAVLAPSDFDLRQSVQQGGLARGQSFGLVQRFPGAARRSEIRRVRVTVFDPEANDTAASADLSAAGALANVSAASFNPAGLAAECITAAYGLDLATTTLAAGSTPLPTALGGTRVAVIDSRGVEREASIFFVSPGQVNYLMPGGTAAGAGAVRITSGAGKVSTGNVSVAAAAPGMFAANANGQGVAAGVVLRVRSDGVQNYEPIAQLDPVSGRFVARPIDLGPATDQVFLVLFGTGIRHRSSLTAVRALIGGADSPVLFAGAQSAFAGLDQINLRLPRSLAGRGEVDVAITVDGRGANLVRISLGGAAQTVAIEATAGAVADPARTTVDPQSVSFLTRLAPVISLPPISLSERKVNPGGRNRKGVIK